jgi:hypothetical protein
VILLALLLLAQEPPRVAAVVTTYYQNSHADVLVSRLLKTDTLDGKGRRPGLALVALYTDQIHAKDIGQALAKEHGVRISATVEDALTLGTGKLAVDGVLLIAEHGDYPRSAVGQIRYPKRRLWEEVEKVFRASGRSVPVFCDKHLSDTWEDAKRLYDAARDVKAPLMAGSSLPTLWREPAVDPPKGAAIEEIVATSYHTLDAYGFHALEMVQAIAERRAGGETGIQAVACLEGEAVWADGLFDRRLLDEALRRHASWKEGQDVRKRCPKPTLFRIEYARIEYADGLRASVLTLNGAASEWSVAWRLKGGETASTLFRTQEARPFMHFAFQLEGVERMVKSGRPSWPAERTLLTSGALDRLHVSRSRGGERLETPELTFAYGVDWTWTAPP